MGLLTLFSKPAPNLLRLPSGSFTVDRDGRLLVGTISSNFPPDLLEQLGRDVLATFREAEAAQLPLSQLILNYASLKVTARELRGGALIFLSPVTPGVSTTTSQTP
jgi:hypothetical protein